MSKLYWFLANSFDRPQTNDFKFNKNTKTIAAGYRPVFHIFLFVNSYIDVSEFFLGEHH